MYHTNMRNIESAHLKIDVPILVVCVNLTPIIEWYVVGCGSKNAFQKDMLKKNWTYHYSTDEMCS